MRTSFFLLMLYASVLCISARAQYVTLDGRQFRDEHGKDFYPVACNFIAEYLCTKSQPQPFFPSPAKDHDGPCYECVSLNSCLDQFTANFKKLRQLHFNTIRLYMLNPGYYARSGDNTKGWAVKALDLDILKPVNCWTQKPANEYTRSFNLSPSFGMDPNLKLVLDYYDAVLLRAAREDLKVLLDLGVAIGDYSPDFMDHYGTYLGIVARHFASKSTPDSVKQAILAYIILEEPSKSWNLSTLWPAVTEGHSKPDAARYVSMWYDSLKRYDPHHLITLGFTPFDLFEYDPSMMKLDFASPHIYPQKQEYEGKRFFQGMLDQARGWYYYLANSLPMPYLIGETGFRSKYLDNNHDGNQGTNEQQRIFAEKTLRIARDCKASGYSWWYYQDYYWGNPLECFWGLYGRDPHTLITKEKPVASAFRNYDPAEDRGSFSPPASYYDPYHHARYAAAYGYDRSGYLHGHVQDQYGKPVKNAYVMGQNRLHGKGSSTWLSSHFTFTDESGDFILIPFDYETDQEPNYNVIETLYVTAPGCSSFHTESWGEWGIRDPVQIELKRYSVQK